MNNEQQQQKKNTRASQSVPEYSGSAAANGRKQVLIAASKLKSVWNTLWNIILSNINYSRINFENCAQV